MASQVSDREIAELTPPAAGGREAQIGFFVLLGLAAGFISLFLLTDPATFRGRYIVATDVEDAGGIRRGDPVQMRGVNIGSVHEFELIPTGVRIHLEIEGEWTIPSDSRTRLASLDLLGGRTVDVIPGGSSERLRGGEVMPGIAVEGVMDLADEIGSEALITLERIRALLGEQAVEDVHASLTDLRTLVGTLTSVVEDQRAEIDSITSSLSRSAGQIEDVTGMEELGRGLARADSTLAQLNVAGGNLARATESLEAILTRIDEGEGTLGLLTTDEALYRNLNAAAMDLSALVTEIREDPGRFIRLRIF